MDEKEARRRVMYKLLSEKVKEREEEIRQRIEQKLGNGQPYVTVDLRRFFQQFKPGRKPFAINFLVRRLEEDYRVNKDDSWLIVEPG